MREVLSELQRWYGSQCDGTWEHTSGVRIDTLDNPGWSVTIDLARATVRPAAGQVIREARDAADWYECSTTAEAFAGAGGPHNLEDILRVFLTWVDDARTGSAT